MAKKTISPLRVDTSKRTITVMTKPFAKKAFCYGTQEYEMLRDVRADYPDFVVVIRQIRKNSSQEHYKGLTYDFMEGYIASHDPDAMDAFLEMKVISKAHSTGFRYPTIKAWFLDRYPEVGTFWISAPTEEGPDDLPPLEDEAA